MKIIFFIDHLRPDGAQFVLKQLVEGLGPRGHDLIVICLNDSWDEALKQTLCNAGAEVRIIGKPALVSGIGLISIYTLLRRERPEAVVTMLFVSDVIGRTLSRLAGINRIITSIETRDEFYNSLQRRLVRLTMPWAHVVKLCSGTLREFAIAVEGAAPEKIIVIPNSIRTADYDINLQNYPLREELGLDQNCYLVGSLGRLTGQKGYDILIKSLKSISNPLVHMVIAGVGDDEEGLRAQTRALNLHNQIHFAGYRRDVPDFLNSLDLYVQPSRFEGMPLAVLQAMASARPIVASAVDGICELIEDGVHGWLVPPEDPQRLSAAMIEALNDQEEASQRGAAARERARSHFDQELMITAWERLLLGNPG